MAQNTTVETTQKGQATTNNTPTGKVTTLKTAEARRKAREEQYRNFRINALKRRCKRMKMSDEDIEKYVKKLIEQMDAPKQYSILVMLNSKDGALMKEALANAKIEYKFHGNNYFLIHGDQALLAKIREIAPPSAKIHPYVKKAESVLPKTEWEVIKKPTNNTVWVRAATKIARKQKNVRIHEKKHKKQSPRPNRHTNKTKVKIGKRAWLKANTTKAILSLSERISKQKAITVQLRSKKRSTGQEKASTDVKKAA